MKAVLIVLIAFVSLIVGAVVIGVANYVSFYDQGVQYRADIDRFDQGALTVLSATTMKLMNAAKVPGKYREDLEGVVKAEMAARYGGGKGGQVMLWVQERQLNFDSSLYKELQLIITAGQDEFKVSQQQKLDVCANFQALDGKLWSGFFLNLTGTGYNDEYRRKCAPILDETTNRANQTKKQEVLEF